MCPLAHSDGHDVPVLIRQHGQVGSRRDGERYFYKMQRHGLGVAEGQDETGALAVLRADRGKDVG
jgi:hypothetical protein